MRQAGRLNGIGGHIEPGETPAQAMQREFREETGVAHGDWYNFGELVAAAGQDANDPAEWRVHLFACFSSDVDAAETVTDEGVGTFSVSSLNIDNCTVADHAIMPNVSWLIPMALSFANGEHCARFIVREVSR